MKKITSDNKIFQSNSFKTDKYKFNILVRNLEVTDVKLYSDEENYVICQSSPDFPAWIWTKDNINIDLVPEIEQAMNLYLTNSGKNKFTCKKELYDLLSNHGYKHLNLDDYFEMGFLLCTETKEIKKCDGKLDIPKANELSIISDYWFADCLEMNGVDSISKEQAKKDAKEMVESKKFYIWRNSNGKIVCMVMYRENNNQARLTHVFTPPDERKKGYATNLIHALTNRLLANGLVPLLYTDYNYVPSNKAYINAGYVDKGILINFSCSS